MNTVLLYAASGLILFGIGVYGLIVYKHFLRKALAVNIMSTGVFIFFIAIGNRSENAVPDPVPHAMVLTGIVVAVCATALMLAIMTRIELISSEHSSGKNPQNRGNENSHAP